MQTDAKTHLLVQLLSIKNRKQVTNKEFTLDALIPNTNQISSVNVISTDLRFSMMKNLIHQQIDINLH